MINFEFNPFPATVFQTINLYYGHRGSKASHLHTPPACDTRVNIFLCMGGSTGGWLGVDGGGFWRGKAEVYSREYGIYGP